MYITRVYDVSKVILLALELCLYPLFRNFGSNNDSPAHELQAHANERLPNT